MKIVHLNTYDTGGSAKAAIRLHKGLIEKNISSTILFLQQKQCEQISNAKYLFNSSFFSKAKIWLQVFIAQRLYIFGIKFRYEGLNFTEVHYKFKLKTYLDNADVIHLHRAVNFLDIKILLQFNKPLVITLHDANYFTGGCHYTNGCTKYTKDCKICPQLEGSILKKNTRNQLITKSMIFQRKNVSIICLSDWMKNQVKQSYVLKNSSISKIYNSLDTETFRIRNKLSLRNKYGIDPSKCVLLFISESLSNPRKGFDLLLEALTKLDNKNKCSLVCIGKKIDINFEDVLSLGIISNEAHIAEIYAMADLFILPSREDNLPNVMLESLLCGTPVLSFSNGGMEEIIEHGKNGYLITDISSYGLKDAIDNFIDKNETFDHKEIRKKALDLFNTEIQIEKHIELYQNLINENIEANCT